MNWLRGIGVVVVVGVLVVVVSVLFLSSSDSDFTEFLDADNVQEVEQVDFQEIQNSDNSNTLPLQVQDPVEAYHQQVRNHVAGSRFEGVYAQYRETNDIELLGVLIDTGLEGGEYEILREELGQVAVDKAEVATIVGPQRILKTLFTVTPLTFKSYERLKNVVDRYETLGLISIEDKHFWYSLVALSKGHMDDYEYYATLTNDQQRIGLIDSVQTSQSAYEYVPQRRGLGLYGVAMYEAGWYRVSQNIASLLQKQDDSYVLGYQLGSWSNLQLHQWSRAESAAQKALQYDTQGASNDQYLLIEAIAVYNQGDYARSALLFNQLEQSEYKDYAIRYAFKIAKKTGESLSPSLKKLASIKMTPSDYYEVVRILYPPFSDLSQDVTQSIDTIIKQCQSDIASSYSYICIMGKAGMLRESGETDKSSIILNQVTKQYPTGHSRELLGEIYYIDTEISLAQESFIEAIRFAQDQEDQERLLLRIQSLTGQ